MSMSVYDATVPILVRSLQKFSALLDKGVAHGLDEAELLDARLAPDMLPFTKQIQIASDTAKGAVARLTGTEAPSMPDTETSIAELKARLEKTIAYVQGVDKALFDGAGNRNVELKFPTVQMTFTGSDYVSEFVMPNLFFHMSVAYALLRARGVQIGKGDFLPVDMANIKFA